MSIGQTIESSGMRQVLIERDQAIEALAGRGVTVVIPCYEQEQYLAESLGSVLKQTTPPLEVIVVDDGSRQPVEPEVKRLAEASGVNVRVIRVANRGLPSARNVGLMNAHGHAFLPLDADDWIESTYIEKTLPLLERADVVCVGLQEHGERKGTYLPGCELGISRLTLNAERTSNRLFYCSLYRTELLRQCGGYNGRMINGYEDWDLWIDLMQRGARLVAVEETLFHYRTRRDSMLAQTEAHWRDWNLDEMARHHGYERPPRSQDRRARVRPMRPIRHAAARKRAP